jgi:hypothetical protein
MFNKKAPHEQRILNWSGVRDENQDFELNTRGVFGGRGLIEDDRLLFVCGGASGAAPADSAAIQQFHQLLNTVGGTNTLAADAALPTLLGARRDFGLATLPDGRVFVIGGRSGPGQGSLITGATTVLEFDPRVNQVRVRSNTGFTARHSLMAAAVQTLQGPRLYAIGGFAGTAANTAASNLVQEYNPSNNTWRSVASVPAPVAEAGVAAAGPLNKGEPDPQIHVLGGNAGSEQTPVVTGGVLRYTPNPTGAGTWEVLPFTIAPRRNLGGAAIVRGVFPTHVFAVGGRDQAGVALTTVESYAATLSQAAPTPANQLVLVATPLTQLPAARHSFGTAIANNRIVVVGGVDAAGADVATIFEYNAAANPAGGTPGAPGTPAGVWAARASLPAGLRRLQVSSPPAVSNFLALASGNRDPRQDAITEWIQSRVRSFVAPNRGSTSAEVQEGRVLFGAEGLTGVPEASCATCHGGAKWSRSFVSYLAPPSPDQLHGEQEVIGAELRKTATQPGDKVLTGVLLDVGTFVPFTAGRNHESQFNPADVGVRANALGGNGFNIPSLLSVHATAPYLHGGLAATLDEVLNGAFDGNGAGPLRAVHRVASAADRARLIEFLKSIDETTPIFP